MTAQIIDGAAIAAQVRAEVVERTSQLRERGVTPGLAAILVGDHAPSISYVTAKAKACEEVGIFSETFHLAAETSQVAHHALLRQGLEPAHGLRRI